MTDPINLTQLRADIDRWRKNDIGDFVQHDTVLALIDTAEAAQALLNGPTRIENHQDATGKGGWLDVQRLYEALARFTTE